MSDLQERFNRLFTSDDPDDPRNEAVVVLKEFVADVKAAHGDKAYEALLHYDRPDSSEKWATKSVLRRTEQDGRGLHLCHFGKNWKAFSQRKKWIRSNDSGHVRKSVKVAPPLLHLHNEGHRRSKSILTKTTDIKTP